MVSKFSILASILLAFIILLQIDLFTGRTGVPQIVSLWNTVAKIKLQNNELVQRNDKMYDEVLSLRHNDEVLSGMARSDLGMVKPGETFYQIIPKSSTP